MKRALTWQVAATVSVVVGLLHLWYHAGYTIDDAYITYRYARNAVHGLGLVYNPGEYVKGYSNTLLTLLCVLPTLANRDPAIFVKLVSAAAFVWMACALYRNWTPRAAD